VDGKDQPEGSASILVPRAFTGCSFVPQRMRSQRKEEGVLFSQYSDQNPQAFHQEQSFCPCGLLAP
jgi:hypothetical protein